MKIQVGRYRDKGDVDWSRYDKGSGVDDDSEGSLPPSSVNSAEGRWHYHAWVEEGPAEEEECHHLVPGGEYVQDTVYHPDVHDVEIASEAIEIPEAIEKMVEALESLYDDLVPEHENDPRDVFVDGLKRILLQAYALGAQDSAPMYFRPRFEHVAQREGYGFFTRGHGLALLFAEKRAR